MGIALMSGLATAFAPFFTAVVTAFLAGFGTCGTDGACGRGACTSGAFGASGVAGADEVDGAAGAVGAAGVEGFAAALCAALSLAAVVFGPSTTRPVWGSMSASTALRAAGPLLRTAFTSLVS